MPKVVGSHPFEERAQSEISQFSWPPFSLSGRLVRLSFMRSMKEFRWFFVSNLVKFTLWVIPAVGFVSWARRARSVRYLGISVSPTNRQWILSLTVTILLLCGVIGLETSVGMKTLSFSGLHFSTTVVGLLFFFLSPLMEEILFRGLVTKEFLIILPSWGANLVASLFFVGVHLPYWLSHGGHD